MGLMCTFITPYKYLTEINININLPYVIMCTERKEVNSNFSKLLPFRFHNILHFFPVAILLKVEKDSQSE